MAAAAAVLVFFGVSVFRLLDGRPGGGLQPAGERGRIVARVEGVESGARIQVRRGVGDVVTLASGGASSLRPGDSFLVESRGAALRFADGTGVRVRPDTEVTIRRWPAEGNESAALGIALLAGPGEVFCEVTKRRAGLSFRVETPYSVSEVLGTRFGVRVDGGKALTTVVDGRVRIAEVGGSRWLVAYAGQQVAACGRTDSRQLVMSKVDPRADLSWVFPAAQAAPKQTPGSGAGRPAGRKPSVPQPTEPSRPSGVDVDLPVGSPNGD
ncbi:FecR domain-containing protein [Planctomycetota bacterium]